MYSGFEEWKMSKWRFVRYLGIRSQRFLVVVHRAAGRHERHLNVPLGKHLRDKSMRSTVDGIATYLPNLHFIKSKYIILSPTIN